MDAGQASLMALVKAFAAVSLGWFLVHGVRMGIDYMSTRGNPRNRAQAHETGRDLLIGAAIVAACLGSAGAYIFGLIKF